MLERREHPEKRRLLVTADAESGQRRVYGPCADNLNAHHGDANRALPAGSALVSNWRLCVCGQTPDGSELSPRALIYACLRGFRAGFASDQAKRMTVVVTLARQKHDTVAGRFRLSVAASPVTSGGAFARCDPPRSWMPSGRTREQADALSAYYRSIAPLLQPARDQDRATFRPPCEAANRYHAGYAGTPKRCENDPLIFGSGQLPEQGRACRS